MNDDAFPPGVQVRRPVADDHGAVSRSIAAWWDVPSAADRHLMLPRLFLQHFCGTSLLAEDARGLAGYLIGFRSPDHPETAYAHFVGVRPDLRRTGLARALYHRFCAEMRERGCRQVEAVTGPPNRLSIAFHTAIGFVTSGDTEIDGVAAYPDYDGPGEHRVVMRRPL